MKKLKKISLTDEINRDAKRIEEEIKSRKDLDDLHVSEDMEASLFNKIQEYEFDKRQKTVYRRKKKKVYLSGSGSCTYTRVRECNDGSWEQVVFEGVMGPDNR